MSDRSLLKLVKGRLACYAFGGLVSLLTLAYLAGERDGIQRSANRPPIHCNDSFQKAGN